MGRDFVRLAAVIALLVVSVNAQVSKRPATTSRRTGTSMRELLPSEYEIKAVILSGQGIFMVGIDPNLDSSASLSDTFKSFFQDHFGTRPPSANRALPKIVLEFGEEEKIEDLAKAINSVRVTPKITVELQSLTTFTTRFIAPPKVGAGELLRVKPNPLTLIVRVDDQNRVTLNDDEMGNLGDLFRLTSSLKEIFHEREQNGVFRPNTNEVEKTVFIQLPLKASAADLLKVGKAIKDAGSDRIGLQTDDIVDTRKAIEEVPLAPPPRKKKPTK